ncbi:MAG: NUDIX hydrolase [Bacilli bacterium]|jgi:ADP-ribose pyrophosphatase|nr:NUDIX hydrolase [Bacilli bacterium]
MDKKEKQISSQEVFKGHIVDVFLDKVTLPNGMEDTREVVRHCKGAAILAFDIDGKILLENQYRYAYDEVITEIPAGKCEGDEDPLDAATRELEEETGYHATNIEPLGVIYPSVGYCDEKLYLYLATGLIQTQRHLDSDEDIDCFKVSLNKMIDLVKDGTIKDAKTIAALNAYLLRFKKIK